MSPEIESRRIRRQFNDKQWSLLVADAEFKSAWDSGNLTRAGEIANPIIYGEVNTRRQLRRRLHKLEDTLFD